MLGSVRHHGEIFDVFSWIKTEAGKYASYFTNGSLIPNFIYFS